LLFSIEEKQEKIEGGEEKAEFSGRNRFNPCD
jgi:hypothetical protein